jgi:hypothetical protein
LQLTRQKIVQANFLSGNLIRRKLKNKTSPKRTQISHFTKKTPVSQSIANADFQSPKIIPPQMY